MNVDAIKDTIKNRFGACSIRRLKSEEDGSNLVFRVEVGPIVTESMIEADFHTEYRRVEATFRVVVTPGGELVETEEI